MTDKPTACDVCGLSVYLLSLQDAISKGVPMKQFMMAALTEPLSACELCQPKMEAAVLAHDWTMLPEGPLKAMFEKETERRNAQG